MGRPKASKLTGKFYLRTDRTPDKNGKFAIYLDYNIGTKHARTDTEIWVEERYWDADKREVNNKHPQCKRLNGQLEKKRRDIDEAIFEYTQRGRLTIDILRALVQGRTIYGKSKKDDFFTYANGVYDDLYSREKIGVSVRDNARCGFNLFRKFLLQHFGEDTLYIGELTEDLVKAYIRWRQGNGNINATINKALTPIIKTARAAVKDNLLDSTVALALSELYLPVKAQYDDDEDVEEVHYLTKENMQAFLTLYNKVKYDRTRDYMDMFLFSFNACGLRFSDILTLEWRHIDFDKRELRKIIFKGDKKHAISLNDDAVKILERWHKRTGDKRFVFGLLDDDFDMQDKEEKKRARLNKNRAIGTSLHALGDKIGLDFNLSMHVARHTFAVWALNAGVDVHKISTMMAHSSVLTTEKVYAKYLPSNLEKEVQEKLNFNLLG